MVEPSLGDATGRREGNATRQPCRDKDTRPQADSTTQVVGTVDEVASISEETGRQSENVAAAEEQTSALAEVTESAQSLADQASQLSRGLESFETAAEGDLSLGEDPVVEASPSAGETDADPGAASGEGTPAEEQ